MSSEYVFESVQDVFDTMSETWEKGDAAQFAACYTEAATVIGPGIYLDGRDDISRSMAAAFAGPLKDSSRPHSPRSARRLSDDAVIVVTESATVLPGEVTTPPDRTHLVTWFLRRHDDRWLIEANHICQA